MALDVRRVVSGCTRIGSGAAAGLVFIAAECDRLKYAGCLAQLTSLLIHPAKTRSLHRSPVTATSMQLPSAAVYQA
jgi:hypothetical protein